MTRLSARHMRLASGVFQGCSTLWLAARSRTTAELPVATSVDHLYRREAVYWWHARVPVRGAPPGAVQVARSLLTRAFPLARNRARRCSAAFDRAMVALMEHPAPTAEQLTQVLDDIFPRILADGERDRAASLRTLATRYGIN